MVNTIDLIDRCFGSHGFYPNHQHNRKLHTGAVFVNHFGVGPPLGKKHDETPTAPLYSKGRTAGIRKLNRLFSNSLPTANVAWVPLNFQMGICRIRGMRAHYVTFYEIEFALGFDRSRTCFPALSSLFLKREKPFSFHKCQLVEARVVFCYISHCVKLAEARWYVIDEVNITTDAIRGKCCRKNKRPSEREGLSFSGGFLC